MALRTLRGHTVVITGATSGIGRETALAFGRAGCKVVAAGRRGERLDEVVGAIEGRGGQALAVRTDVADEAQVEALIERSVERFGRVDVLVNNAGVGMVARFDEQPIEDFRRLMDVNFWGAVYGCKAVVPRMRAQPGGGVIINVSSILGRRGIPYQTAYCASKFAMRGFSEALRVEVMAAGIDVSTIFPGAVETEFFGSASNQSGIQTGDAANLIRGFPARDLAAIIVQDARFPQPEIVMALDAIAIDFFNRVAPAAVDFALSQSTPFMEGMRESTAAALADKGNLYSAGEDREDTPSSRRRGAR